MAEFIVYIFDVFLSSFVSFFITNTNGTTKDISTNQKIILRSNCVVSLNFFAILS